MVKTTFEMNSKDTNRQRKGCKGLVPEQLSPTEPADAIETENGGV